MGICGDVGMLIYVFFNIILVVFFVLVFVIGFGLVFSLLVVVVGVLGLMFIL